MKSFTAKEQLQKYNIAVTNIKIENVLLEFAVFIYCTIYATPGQFFVDLFSVKTDIAVPISFKPGSGDEKVLYSIGESSKLN